MRRQIRDSRAIVTGASSGIGREIARQLAHHGAAVVLTARRQQRLEHLAAEIISQGGRAEVVAGDLADPQTRQAVIDCAKQCYGGLDILVNNAGLGGVGLFEHADCHRLRRIMEVNFFAAVEMIRLALPLLKQGRNPIVVNVASILGHRGIPYCTEYCASKFALRGFSESLRAELSLHNIDVLVVSPGTTETEFFDSVIHRTAEPPWPKHKPASPARVAACTISAIQRGRHEIIPYFWGHALVWLNRLFPRFIDRLMTRWVR